MDALLARIGLDRWDNLPPFVYLIQRRYRRLQHHSTGTGQRATPKGFVGRYVLRVHTLLILLWIWLLHWGEVRIYDKEVGDCEWESWEKWPKGATPHHLAFVADPQLVDPHTYPGRPWPLSTITVSLTDKYLKRSYRTMQRRFDPDTVYFLGDLFDGGREWSTGNDFVVVDSRWKSFGRHFWSREYDRFANIFFDRFQVSGGREEQRGKNIIASLPGNHDLGFATGIQVPVRRRFRAYFGKGDRVDIIGNHTFVGVDTVSLSAMVVAGSEPELWKSSNDFLEGVQDAKRQAVETYLGRPPPPLKGRKFKHNSVEAGEKNLLQPSEGQPEDGKKATTELPTVLLSHVPLYREPGSRCGWLREKWPPINLDQEHDERNSIRVGGAGYQYQNVLSRKLSKTIAEKVGNVDYAFSGDDHDYCELTHRGYPSSGRGIHEITVKSLSFAMGIDRPGFLLVSLWNPIDDVAKPLPGSPGALRNPTLHSHLCLLPNQIAVYTQYVYYLIVSVVIVLVSSVMSTRKARDPANAAQYQAVLPIDEPSHKSEMEDTSISAVSGVSGANGQGLATRSVNGRTRASHGANGANGYGIPSGPLIDRAGYYGSKKKDDYELWSTLVSSPKGPPGKRMFIFQWLEQFRNDLVWVAMPSLAWFLWLWHKH